MKILVVDDERFNLVMARDIIVAGVENDGVIMCNKPEEAMALLAEHDIDIVLLDIIMPRVNGIDLLREIRSREKYKDVQVIMFTGVTDKESFRVCFENGADDFISKPIDVTEFTARMKAAVKTRKNVSMLKEMFNKMAEQYNELQEVTKKLKDTQFYLLQQEKLASLGEIAAGVAHEINNPIGFVGSNLETLEKYLIKIKEAILSYRHFVVRANDENSSRQELLQERQSLEEMEKKQKIGVVLEDLAPLISESKDGVERVAKIVRSLRNFARTGKEDELILNDFNQIVQEALLITRNEVKYTANVEKRLNPMPEMICDKSQIAQVLINIIINASHAIKSQNRESMGNISVETYQDGQYVVCRISDDGPGISKEYLGRIFDPFFTTKEVGSGTGLGLSIAYGIINKHGGELLVESKPGTGAAFIVKLPLQQGD
ncbi:MAG: response regulator [Negativicutes bacterium]|nr:response regulator [Negativicutes bacterium]